MAPSEIRFADGLERFHMFRNQISVNHAPAFPPQGSFLAEGKEHSAVQCLKRLDVAVHPVSETAVPEFPPQVPVGAAGIN